MRLKQYILNEGIRSEGIRSKSVSKEWALEWVRKNARKSLLGTIIERELLKYSNVYRYTDPKKSPGRTSMNTSNIYNILFRDILTTWKGWPKREVICSSSNSNREMWERSYRVFFRDNTLIGVCPSYDIWDSFEHIGGMDVFNDDIERSYKKITGKELDISKNGIIKGMKELDKEMDKEKAYEDYSFPIELIKGESIIDTLNKSLDPKKNGFKQVKVGSNLPVGNEVWSDKDCVLVSGGEVEEFLNEI